MKTTFKKITKLVGIMLAMALAVSLVGCGVDITSVGLPTDIVLEKGETQQLNIEYGTDDKAEQEKIAEAASKLNLTWTSSDEEVATVNKSRSTKFNDDAMSKMFNYSRSSITKERKRNDQANM